MKKNILVVDDDYFIRSLLYLFLKENYEVALVENGLEAMLWLDQGNIPDAILTDIDMPEIDGFNLLLHLKKSGYYRQIPTIILTGHQSPDITEKFRESGATDFITKPFNPGELLDCLKNLLVEEEMAI